MDEPADASMRAVIVGFGAQAERAHLPAIRAAAGVELVGCVDASPARRARARQLCPGARIGVGVEAVVQAAAADLVIVATPPRWRVEPIVESMSCGVRRFVCEKPIAGSRPQLARLRSLARGLEIFPCHTWMQAAVYRAALAALQRGEIGVLRRAVFEIYRTQHALGSEGWVPDWRVRPELAGGGILMDHGYHCVYLLANAFRAWPSAVQMIDRSTARYNGVEDRCELQLQYPGGYQAAVHLDWSAGFRKVVQRFEGDRGTLEIEGQDVWLTPQGGSRGLLERAPEADDGIHLEWYHRLYEELVAAMRSPGSIAERFADAVRTMDVLFAAYDSAEVTEHG